ncbi:BPG-independent [Mycena vulgaris]|nr:BPG-independent [Mycena vulgaris]
MSQVKDKVYLIVHDGWGATQLKFEAGSTVNMDTIGAERSQRVLAAHGTAVGLKVGHLNIGAGRIVWQDIVRIDVSIKKREFHKNKYTLVSFKRAKEGNGRLHFIGLISDGGVHSHITHLYAFFEAAKEQGVPHVYDLLDFMAKEGYDALATVVGRYYAMDRDKRWERVKIAIDGFVGGVGVEGATAVDAIKKNYEADVTDEFLKPIIVNGAEGRVKDEDTLFFFNYRSDRMRELVSVFGLPDKPMEVAVPMGLHITTMSTYNVAFPFAVAFPLQAMTNVLAEWLASQGVKQAHIAETEKYAHVTFFFPGGVEAQFALEERHMVPSPKVATYDLQPEMSVQAVADTVARVVETQEHDFVMCNFAPPDMVRHTGSFEAAVRAISHTDAAVGTVYAACQRAGYVLLVTADHGNAKQMRNNETGAPHTAHTCNPLPFILAARPPGEEPGALCDVAPTVLDIMGLPQPAEMTDRSPLVRK